jgi:succinate-acetate transporter protein
MIRKVELVKKHEVFAEPTSLGLIGLARGCAALTPIAFGVKEALNPAGFRTAAMFCLLFGGGCQLVAGLMNFANKNLFGGTILTAFSFNWILNWWQLSAVAEFLTPEHPTSAILPNHEILLATDAVSLVIFLVITYGFGFFSKLLFAFLFDIDLLYACKVAKAVAGTKALDMPIAWLTVILGLIALWIAFAGLINPTAGRAIFAIPGPMFHAPKKAGFDWSVRNAMFEVLFKHWETNAFKTLRFDELRERMKAKVGDRNILPDLAYLMEYGAVVVTTENEEVVTIRLSAEGIDLYEQLVLKKYDF